jgi:glycerol-3-phosphate acyltransferase PlsX
MLTIALDAMGGDRYPQAEVEGAILAARQLGVKIILVGQQDRLQQELRNHAGYEDLPIEILHASERVTMDDNALAVRTKSDSSLKVASRLVRDGKAAGLVSAGNTGAVMATAKIVMGVIPGVTRPALAGVFPTVCQDRPVVVLDVGANVDCSARMLAQFAVMGEIYSRVVLHRPKPRVGILSIGEEEHKGNDLTHAAWPLLRAHNLDFMGNVEGSDLYAGEVDVIVCDGFVGNVALKVSEGLVDMMKLLLRESLQETITGKIGALLAKQAFTSFRKRVDYSEYGGAPLLGIRGVCIVGHGRSDAKAIKNAISMAQKFSEGHVNQRIEDELRRSEIEKTVVKAK